MKRNDLPWWIRIQLGIDTRLRIYDMLASYLSAGIALKLALTKMRQSEFERRGNSALHQAYTIMLKRLGSGKKLGDLFVGMASDAEIMILNAMGSNIKDSFKAVLDVTNTTRAMNKGFYGAQIYPLVLYTIAYLFLVLYSAYILPDFLQSLPTEGNFSLLTELGMFLSKDFYYWVPISLILNVGTFVTIAYSLPSWKGKSRTLVEKIPPYSMYRLKVGCSWLVSVASLIRAGVKLDRALEQLQKYASPYLHYRVAKIIFHLKRGANLGLALTKTGLDFPDSDLVDRIGVYAQAKDFSNQIDGLVQEFAERGIEKINSQANVIRSLGMVIVAVVGMLVTGINFSVTQDLTNTAQQDQQNG